MKKVLPLICLLATSFITASAQLPASPAAATDSNVGVSNPAPLYRLDVQTAVDNDGMRLRGINPGNLRLRLNNTFANKEYSFLTGGPSSSFGNGNFVITDVSRLDSVRFLINGNTGNIAIGGGSINPAEALTVNGMVQMTGMRITHNPGINKIMASDASGAASWQPANALNLISGSGSFNYITKWTPNGFTLGNSQMVDDGTYVGIGNVTPQYKLDLGTAQDNDGMRLRSTNTGNLRLRFNNAGTNKEYSFLLGGTGSAFGNGNLAITDMSRGDTAVFLINSTTGNVGIGSSNPNPPERLTVTGTVFTYGLKIPINAGVNKVLTSDADGVATWQTPGSGVIGGSGTLNYVPKWTPNGFTLANSQLVDDGNNVGIGNVTPLRKLDINAAASYAGVNITSPQIPSLNLTSTNITNTGREVIRFGEPAATPGSSTVNAQIGYYRTSEVVNAANFVLSVDNAGTRPDISISKANSGNVGIGIINATQKLDVNGIVRSTGLLIPTNAGTGKVLTSDASGNATWQTPAAGGTNVIYSNWAVSPYISRDTSIDGTCVKVRQIDAPSVSATALSSGVLLVYLKVGTGLGPYNLPYICEAGGATNQIGCIFNQQKIFLTRHTFKSCRYSSSIAESYPGEPVMVNFGSSIEYRYVIILGTQPGGRAALGPNEHYASSVNDIPDMGPGQGVPGKVYSSVKE
jgi:hypothetical protein